jgi:Putative prokaryotic signal transducing protein
MKNDSQIKSVYRAMNKFEAETIRLLLESFEIPVELIGESAGTAIGLGVGPLGEVSVFVPADRAEEAVSLIERMEKGEFELPPDKPETP